MKIYIERIVNENIYFFTDYGMGKGIWKGTDRPIEKAYYVELDVDKLYNYEDIIISKTEKYQIKLSDEINQLTLLLIEYDEEGCATFRLGDSIIEIETNFDERFYTLKNSYVMLLVERLNVYDENL